MVKMIAALLCLVAAVSADHEWSERSWKVNKENGQVTMVLEKQATPAKPSKSTWYPATISKDHSDVKSWAMLEHEGETYLVGAKKEMKGKALPSEEDELLVFKVDEKVKMQHQGKQMVMKLSPQKPEKKEEGMMGGMGGGMGGMLGGKAGPISDLEGKDALWWPWAPFWAPWPAWAWAWPAWPFWPAKVKSLERNEEAAHLMALEGELAELIGLEKEEGKGGIPAWSGFDPIPGLPHSLYNWVDTPPAIGSLYPAKKAEAAAPKKVEEAAKKWGVWPYGVWWAGAWYWPK